LDDLLLRKWPALRGQIDIPGLPSPGFGEDTLYNAVTLVCNENGWTAQLFSDEEGEWPDYFIPEIWHADEFQDLFTAKNYRDQELGDIMAWTSEELAGILIEYDERWRPFVEAT
jgi:hypothetical protein